MSKVSRLDFHYNLISFLYKNLFLFYYKSGVDPPADGIGKKLYSNEWRHLKGFLPLLGAGKNIHFLCTFLTPIPVWRISI